MKSTIELILPTPRMSRREFHDLEREARRKFNSDEQAHRFRRRRDNGWRDTEPVETQERKAVA